MIRADIDLPEQLGVFVEPGGIFSGVTGAQADLVETV
jgi:hypothetical protein